MALGGANRAVGREDTQPSAWYMVGRKRPVSLLVKRQAT